MDSTHDPIDVFAEVARSLAKHDTLETTLQGIVDLAVPTVPGAQFAAISIARARQEVETFAATDDICHRVDHVQYETGQGPCLDAIWEAETVRIDDLGATERWPDFAYRAVELGIGSMLSLRLFVEENTLGALNLYAEKPHAFTDESVRIGDVFAAHAAVAWDHAKETGGLQAAMATRNLIGQAQGIVMAEQKVDADVAFSLLRTWSQRRNTKLRDVAQLVVDAGSSAAAAQEPSTSR